MFFGPVVCAHERWCINTWPAQVLICSSWLMHDWSLWSSQHRPHLSRWIKLIQIWVRCSHNKGFRNDHTGPSYERGFVQLHLNKNVLFSQFLFYISWHWLLKNCVTLRISAQDSVFYEAFWSGEPSPVQMSGVVYGLCVCSCSVHVCLCGLTISVSTGRNDIVEM